MVYFSLLIILLVVCLFIYFYIRRTKREEAEFLAYGECGEDIRIACKPLKIINKICRSFPHDDMIKHSYLMIGFPSLTRTSRDDHNVQITECVVRVESSDFGLALYMSNEVTEEHRKAYLNQARGLSEEEIALLLMGDLAYRVERYDNYEDRIYFKFDHWLSLYYNNEKNRQNQIRTCARIMHEELPDTSIIVGPHKILVWFDGLGRYEEN